MLPLKLAFDFDLDRKKSKMAFQTPHGIYEACVAMTGLENATGEFQTWVELMLQSIGTDWEKTNKVLELLTIKKKSVSQKKSVGQKWRVMCNRLPKTPDITKTFHGPLMSTNYETTFQVSEHNDTIV
jgi:hypothetical protein